MSFLKGLRGICAPMAHQRGACSSAGHPFTLPLMIEPPVRNRRLKRQAKFIPAVETLEARLTPSNDPLVQPQVLHSVNGVLDITLTEQVSPVKIGDNVVQDAWTYNGMYPGPTLQLNPGDTLNLKLVNKLPMDTNLHTHGLHVSPIGSSDNILLDI